MTHARASQKLTVLTSNSQRGVLAALGPAFERSSGYALSVSYDPAQVMLRRIAAGESADVAILAKPAIDALIEDGTVDGAARRTLARCGSGIAVRAGAPAPDISTVEALRHALLECRSIIYTSEGASGMHFSRVIEQLGITHAIEAKARRQTGGLVAERVASGEVELAVQQIPELLAVPGVELVGPLPSEVQAYSIVTAGIFKGCAQQPGAQALLDFLATPAAMGVFRAQGLEPA